MKHYCRCLYIGLFLGIVFCLFSLHTIPIQAQVPPYDPPIQVTLTMYQLIEGGVKHGERVIPLMECKRDNLIIATSFGCTAITKSPNRTPPYPFENSTITISIDGTDGPDNVGYPYAYLWDVVTIELGVHQKGDSSLPNSGYISHSAIEAQAIAARTFTFHRDEYFDDVDNSTEFHAYLPYSYQALLDDNQKEDVRLGTQRQLYLAESNTSYPLDAQYGADNLAQTVAGTPTFVSDINYLRSVEDPISAKEGTVNGNGIGMSSNGAKRWSYGHQAAQPGANSDDDQWSARWDQSFQILTHYYTGVHIRDVTMPDATVSETPDYRWVPLQIQAPVIRCAAAGVPISVRVQNTGTVPWPAGTVHGCSSVVPGLTAAAVVQCQQPTDPLIPVVVERGDEEVITITIDLPVGQNTYTLDLYSTEIGQQFSQQSPSWPQYVTHLSNLYWGFTTGQKTCSKRKQTVQCHSEWVSEA